MVCLPSDNCLIHKHRGSTLFLQVPGFIRIKSWGVMSTLAYWANRFQSLGGWLANPHRVAGCEMCDQRAVDLSHKHTCYWETHKSVSKNPRSCFGSSWTLIGRRAGTISSPSLTIYLMTHTAKYDALSSTQTHLHWHVQQTSAPAFRIWFDTQLSSIECKGLETASQCLILTGQSKESSLACGRCNTLWMQLCELAVRMLWATLQIYC